MPFTVEYTHKKVRGLLSASTDTQQNAEIAFNRTVGLMSKPSELHLETIQKHDTRTDSQTYAIKWAKERGKPDPTLASTTTANGTRVFEGATSPPDEVDDE